MIRHPAFTAAVLLGLGVLAGCAPYTGFSDEIVQQYQLQQLPTDLKPRTYNSVDRMVDELIRQHPEIRLDSSPAVVGSVADIADINRSTPLGNTIADLMRTRLVQRGLLVTDMRLRSSVAMQRYVGELVLSRDRSQVYLPPQASMIVSGTYAVAHSSVFVSLKVIHATNAGILAAADFRLPRTGDVAELLADAAAIGR